MRRHIFLALVLGSLWLASVPSVVLGQDQASSGMGLGLLPTSPAGATDSRKGALPERIILRARAFRGNPLPLGVLTGAVLLVAVGLGVYTVRIAYHRD
jgi:hypothetical protein